MMQHFQLKQLWPDRKGNIRLQKFSFCSLCVTAGMSLNKPVTKEFPHSLLGEHRFRNTFFGTRHNILTGVMCSAGPVMGH
jgi:hypothetical protein